MAKADMTQQQDKRLYPRNPIGVVALFVSFIEVVATVSLKFVLDASSPWVGALVTFILAFPSAIAVLFFATLWFRRESLYSPGDFREDFSFLALIRKVETLEVKQQAAQLDPAGDPGPAAAVAARLVEREEFESAIHLARAFLKVQRYDSSCQLFDFLRKAIPRTHPLSRSANELFAYSLVGLKRYSAAIEVLLEQGQGEAPRFWPSLALAYSYLKLEQEDQSSAWLRRARQGRRTTEYLPLVRKFYPEIADKLEQVGDE